MISLLITLLLVGTASSLCVWTVYFMDDRGWKIGCCVAYGLMIITLLINAVWFRV